MDGQTLCDNKDIIIVIIIIIIIFTSEKIGTPGYVAPVPVG